ncbi:MAG: hypothetical protein PW792_03630 [Acidobacteriaceae bacterium]|nr:hypothetical protein [Acidobacteriaceae bacterium]
MSRRAVAFALALVFSGCVSSGNPSPVAPGDPLSITKQPADASVPMGLTATFSVQASGSNLQYQWLKSGASISGATSSSYTTPITAYADDGSSYSVRVSGQGGSVTSSVAHLSVTARAPVTGDLRFGQVGSSATVNGYSVGDVKVVVPVGCPPPGGSSPSYSYGGFGSSLQVGNNACTWSYEILGLSASIRTFYGVAQVAQLDSVLSQSSTPELSGSDSRSVVSGLQIPSVYSSYVAYTYRSDSQGAAYTRSEATVSVADFPAIAAQEAASGRVITAFYVLGSNVTYFAYGWAGDPNSVYETQVVSGTLATAADMVKSLAAQGYIVTASTTGQAADGSGVWIVGTRFQGDATPRPVLVEYGGIDQLEAGGYALVIWSQDFNGGLSGSQLIGER